MKNKSITYKVTNKLTPERINEILKIEAQVGLTPENLVAIASANNNPLHDLFEWDDNVAGIKYRLYQARLLINDVKVIVDSQEYFAFENVQIACMEGANESQPQTQRIYKPIMEILSSVKLRQQIIQAALRQHEYWEKQNMKYKELAPVIYSAKQIRKQLESKWNKKKK